MTTLQGSVLLSMRDFHRQGRRATTAQVAEAACVDASTARAILNGSPQWYTRDPDRRSSVGGLPIRWSLKREGLKAAGELLAEVGA